MHRIISSIPLNILSHWLNFPLSMPVSLAFSITYRCNFKCKTCQLWQAPKKDEMDLLEIEKSFQSLGRGLYWITLDGGEPFLREDLPDICRLIYKNSRPAIINIPTNGSLPNETEKLLRKILQACSNSNIIINLSLDHIGERHDAIRNYPDSFNLVLETYKKLRAMRKERLRVGFNTAISSYNAKDLQEIYAFIKELKPDSHLFEIAQLRDEFRNRHLDYIVPDEQKCISILRRLSNLTEINRRAFTGRALYAMRKNYYSFAAKTLASKRQLMPCFAGIASAYILPDGEVWACCNNARVMGSLKEFDFDFRRLWGQWAAKAVRRHIKKNKCFCIQANANYLNMLHSHLYLPKLISHCLSN